MIKIWRLIKKCLYRLYKRIQHSALCVTPLMLYHNRIQPYLRRETRPCRYRRGWTKVLRRETGPPELLKNIRMAMVCDEMTFRDFKPECNCVFVTPANWLFVFRNFKPDVFFCESAWTGIRRYAGSWRGRIYRSRSVRFENRRDLLNILDYCQRAGIPTIFWNKEDPTFFGNPLYDFVDTALRFDWIFTTAQECVDRYRALGHNAQVLMFGFAPTLFNPLNRSPTREKAVFAGSWYGDQPERCADMAEILDMLQSQGIELLIYDRQYGSSNPVHHFPERYQPYIKPAVDFKELSRVFRECRYAININTVKDSQTMFARRVFELMASDLLVISNESRGMRDMFNGRVWFAGEKFERLRAEDIRARNLRDVFLHHTCRQRLSQMLVEAGITTAPDPRRVLILYRAGDGQAAAYFGGNPYPDKTGAVWDGVSCRALDGSWREQEPEAFLQSSGARFFVIAENARTPDLAFALSQFSYLGENTGIRQGEPRYRFVEDAKNTGVLFPARFLPDVLAGRVTRKFIIPRV